MSKHTDLEGHLDYLQRLATMLHKERTMKNECEKLLACIGNHFQHKYDSLKWVMLRWHPDMLEITCIRVRRSAYNEFTFNIYGKTAEGKRKIEYNMLEMTAALKYHSSK